MQPTFQQDSPVSDAHITSAASLQGDRYHQLEGAPRPRQDSRQWAPIGFLQIVDLGLLILAIDGGYRIIDDRILD